jgi:hypothetical protein
LAEVNFWQPSAGRQPARLEPRSLFLFKLHASHGGQIVGGRWFLKYEAMPIRWTSEAFGEDNGPRPLTRWWRASGSTFVHRAPASLLTTP